MSTTTTSIPSRDKLSASLRRYPGNRALKTLLQAPQSSCAYKGHIDKTQWVLLGVHVEMEPHALFR